MTALPTTADAVDTPAPPEPVQRVVKVRRDYNDWVARETMEDYALRFTPRAFRKWSVARVANMAFGASSFLVLEAVGATLMVSYGFTTAALAILVTGLVIFLAGLPISVYAARYGVDMDLLTRGAGFGYIGSTITSLIYASFTFIFFALEAAVMAYALELAFDIPPAWGYLICALLVLPLVAHGVTNINRLQIWTQPLWLVMLVLPYVFVLNSNPGLLEAWTHYAGESGHSGFDWRGLGAATTVGIALMTQMGEQADYLRFMPEPKPGVRGERWRWWAAVLVGGPGWVIPGVLKMLGGALLAFLAIERMVPVERAVDPNQMYLAAYETVFPHLSWAVAATALFVIVSQLKINVTNAYAGSLAWSNFFSRVAHSHPGRVVWMVFNTGIALLLMELDVFQALGGVLGLYSNVAISWLMAVVADLVINKPMGWSPPGIEFKRAHLYDVNPVGVGAMALASLLSVSAHLGLFGPMAQAWSASIALVTAFVASPLLAWATKGRFYLARQPQRVGSLRGIPVVSVVTAPTGVAARRDGSHGAPGAASQTGLEDDAGRYAIGQPGVLRLTRCCICERDYEVDDMAHCPAYQGDICSLCCTLDARCNDLCKPQARLSAQWLALCKRVLPTGLWSLLDKGLSQYLLLMFLVAPLLGGFFVVLYHQGLRAVMARTGGAADLLGPVLKGGFLNAYAAVLVVAGVAAWWLVLAHKSRLVAQEESNRQTQALHEQAQVLQRQATALKLEIESHQRTDSQLQDAKRVADEARHQAEGANQAKSRYITNISHELRTPLNSILGYAQLLDDDPSIPAHRRHAIAVIRRGGDHLLSLIEGTLDLARIESGKLTLEVRPMRLRETLDELVQLFALQAAARGVAFRFEPVGELPAVVRADEKRLRQVLINLLGNAVKFTRVGQVTLRVSHAREMARFDIEDTGPGMSADELARVFEPFERGHSAAAVAPGWTPALGAPAAALPALASVAPGGTGLGLTIAKMLTDLMGGEMTVRSTPGSGTIFSIRLFLPVLHETLPDRAMPGRRPAVRGYHGERRRVLVVDNEEADRRLMVDVLEPLGFEIETAVSGEDCLSKLARSQAEGLAPHAIFMDLAMPGIDGWETIRRLRGQGLSAAPIAIVSANAFDKTLDNDVGITPASFLVKPVRVGELLDWLGQSLALAWVTAGEGAHASEHSHRLLPGSGEASLGATGQGTVEADRHGAALPGAPADPAAEAAQRLTPGLNGGPERDPSRPDTPASPAKNSRTPLTRASAPAFPPPEALARLRDPVRLGHVRGVLNALALIEEAHPESTAFVEHLRSATRQFRLDAVQQHLDEALTHTGRATDGPATPLA